MPKKEKRKFVKFVQFVAEKKEKWKFVAFVSIIESEIKIRRYYNYRNNYRDRPPVVVEMPPKKVEIRGSRSDTHRCPLALSPITVYT